MKLATVGMGVMVMVAAAMVCTAGTAWGDEMNQQPAAMVSAVALEPLRGLSADQPGRVAGSVVSREGVVIAPRSAVGDSTETAVTPAARIALAPPPAGVIDDQILAGEIASRFEPLGGCRIEAARHRNVAVASIPANSVMLRWTIAASGRATDAQVVSTTPTDPAVLQCVKQQMLDWTFTRPLGGPLPVQRAFVFRHFGASAAAP